MTQISAAYMSMPQISVANTSMPQIFAENTSMTRASSFENGRNQIIISYLQKKCNSYLFYLHFNNLSPSIVAEAAYPTLNLSSCAHPETCTAYLDAEKKLKGGDGLFAGRFQFMCSEPVFPHVDDIKMLDPEVASLERLFLAISVLHTEPLLYTYDSTAEKLIKSCYDNIQDFLKANHHKDSFLCGKYILCIHITSLGAKNFKSAYLMAWVLT